ncbi:aprataxin [Perkinsela sp. CCAP 1560/4]|nr:aprataxin [Perkinsela sp. CCAP 1560/4]|eukprot:KNH04571.1 aprataxin [Perkinsela sp. CCAP 1560/4]
MMHQFLRRRLPGCSSVSPFLTHLRFDSAQPAETLVYNEPPMFAGKNSLNALKEIQLEVQRTGNHPLLFQKSGDFIAIYDQFPKSKYHLLVIPRKAEYESIHAFDTSKRDDLRFLIEMIRFGDQIIHRTLKRIDPGRVFISGFHSIPSLHPIHLHVMSVDLEGRAMRKKKHYNSFATSFFLESHETLKKLLSGNRVDRIEHTSVDLQKVPMKCIWCDEGLEDISSWRNHAAGCRENLTSISNTACFL